VSYEVLNVSKTTIHENLDSKNKKGKLDTFVLGPRKKAVLTDAQFASRRVQRHVLKKRLRAKKLPDATPTTGTTPTTGGTPTTTPTTTPIPQVKKG
jgi:hypothetical protein